tara:strand:+ start:1274 stop:1861 length:588 start_codon:yes stop_codon:yes gene_type:complete
LKTKTKKIALFGTSADPPTNGHRIIIEELSKNFHLVISYASDNPSKKHKENLFFRSLLLKTLIENINNPKIHFDQDLSSPWAINTFEKCKKKYQSNEIFFVIGSDLLGELFFWKNINEILNELNLYIIPRKDYPINLKDLKLLKDKNINFEISKINVPKISSSLIRKDKNYLGLPESLVPIIKKNNLYRPLNKSI